jgi:hypothetical protein
MRTLLFVLAFYLLLGSAAQAQSLLATTRQVTMVGDDKPALTSEKKDLLAKSVARTAFAGSVFLQPLTVAKVISQTQYDTKETVGPTAQRVKRTYKVALIEVLDEPNKGKKGWVVVSVQDEGQDADVYLAPPRP